MINRRQLITTASAFVAAAHLPAMPLTASDVLEVTGRKLIIDEPLFIDIRGFSGFDLNDCILVFRGQGAIVITDDDKILSGEKPHSDGLISFHVKNTRNTSYVRHCTFFDECVGDACPKDYEAITANMRRTANTT